MLDNCTMYNVHPLEANKLQKKNTEHRSNKTVLFCSKRLELLNCSKVLVNFFLITLSDCDSQFASVLKRYRSTRCLQIDHHRRRLLFDEMPKSELGIQMSNLFEYSSSFRNHGY